MILLDFHHQKVQALCVEFKSIESDQNEWALSAHNEALVIEYSTKLTNAVNFIEELKIGLCKVRP